MRTAAGADSGPTLPPIQVGPVYGRKTMTCLLTSQGLKVRQTKVGESLRRTNITRSDALQLPGRWILFPYTADYFGHKVHLDENEKLVMYGVTHVCAKVGYSGKVVRRVHNNASQKQHGDRSMHIFTGIRCIVHNYKLWMVYCRELTLTYRLGD